MALTVHQFPCLQDNYAFLCRDEASGLVACIDTPDSDAILREADAIGWTVDMILNTHWHPDHAGGNAAIKQATGAVIVAPEEVRQTSGIDRVVTDGDLVELGETIFRIMDVGGHTLGHIAYHDAADGIVFAGDALFPMGCGRLFEGTPQQMWASLSRLAGLPSETLVYSAHEYTLANARFAVSVDRAAATLARAAAVEAARSEGKATVPTTMGEELLTNPFLRAPLLLPDIGGTDPAEAFARIRAAKDNFKG